MKKLWGLVGNILFWLVWPGLYIYLANSHRTRVVVSAEGKVLVVKGWLGDGSWSLPGGGVHKGETAINSALRELKEETGIELAAAQLVSPYSLEVKHRGIPIKITSFLVKLPRQLAVKPQLGEISDVQWISLNRLLNESRVSPDTLQILNRKS